MTEIDKPLAGIRVLDLTRLLPGAFCTQQLADMGADVIKVEEPEAGDYMRWTPPLVDGRSALFDALNRNKRSVALDLKTDRGLDALLRLVDTAQVLVEGNRPASWTGCASAGRCCTRGIRVWSCARSPATARTAHTRFGPATTSTTWRSQEASG